MRRPGNLNGLKMRPRALNGLGQYGYSLPKGNYGLSSAVQYYPAIQELASMPGLPYDGAAHDAKAKELCGQIKAKIESLITKATNAGDAATAQEMQNIYKEGLEVEAAERKEQPPFPEAPLLPMWRKAEKLVDDLAMWIKTPVVAAAAANAVSSVIPNSPSSNVYDTSLPVSSDSSKTILMVGGLGLGLLVLLMVSRILKRKKVSSPASRRKKKK